MAKKTKKDAKTNKYREANFFLVAVKFVILIYAYLLVCVYPFMIKAGYEVTSYVKYGFLVSSSYAFVTGPLIIPTFIPVSALLILIGTIMYIRKKYCRREGTPNGKDRSNILSGIREFAGTVSFSATDIAVGLYAVFVIISSVISPYKDEIVWGYPSWYMGLASQFIFIYCYFVFSRFFDKENLEGLVYASFAASAVVFLIGIFQRFGSDIFNLYQGEPTKFISTIGQRNFFASYMIIFLMTGVFAVWISDRKTVLYKAGLVYIIIGSVVLPLQDSEMAYSGLFIGMSLLFVMSFDGIGKMKAFWEITLVMTLSWRLTGIVWTVTQQEYKFDEITALILLSPLMWIAIAVIAVIYIIVRKLDGRRVEFDMKQYRMIGKIYSLSVVLIILLLVVYIILNTKEILPEAIRSKDKYLLFNETWGSSRGAILHDTMLSFTDEFVKHPARALFGAGPDMFYHVIEDNVREWVGKRFGQTVLTNAHNEWLTAFINYGIFGGISYLGIFISSIISGVRNRVKVPLMIGVAVCVAAYVGNDMFAYQQYVSTPYIFIIMGIGEQLRRSFQESS